jgi:chromosome segregation ATPase
VLVLFLVGTLPPLLAGDIGGWVTTALGVFSLATAAGLGLQIGRIKDLRTQLSDTREEVRALREGRAADKADMAEKDLALSKVTSEVELLQTVVTREVEWRVLTNQVEDQTKHLDDQTKTLAEHHRKAEEVWAKDDERAEALEERAASIEAQIGSLLDFFRDQARTDNEGTKKP